MPRVAVGIGGLALVLLALAALWIPAVVLDSGVRNECLFDGGADDCYDGGTRALVIAWGTAGIAMCAACLYAGGAGIYWAFSGRSLPGAGLVGIVAFFLLVLVVGPLLISALG